MCVHRERSLKRLGLVMALALALTVVLTGFLLATPAAAAEVPHSTFKHVTLTGPVTGVVVPGDPGPLRLQGSQVQAETADEVSSGLSKVIGRAEPGPDGRFGIQVDPQIMNVVLTEVCDPSSCILVRAEVSIVVRFIPTPDLPDGSGVHYATFDAALGPCKLDPSDPSNIPSPLVCDPPSPFTSRPTSRFGNIEGTVTDATGQPVPRAFVSASAVNPTCDVFGCFPGSHTEINATGFYRFPPWLADLPMFGANLNVYPQAPRDYFVSADIFGADFRAFLGPKRVTVRGGEIRRVDFVFDPTADRLTETALGRPGGTCDPRYRGGPVNITSGNMYTEMVDLVYPSAFGALAFSRSYNSQSTYQGPLGVGWTHPFDFELKETTPGLIRVRYGDGSVRFYELVSGSTDTYRPAAPARETSTLVKNAGGFTETERSGLRREFDHFGKLQAIVNRLGWRITLTYAGNQLASVTDQGGRTLAFSYTVSFTGSLLTRVDGPGGLFVEYVYDAQARLVEAKDALGTLWTYSYTDTTSWLLTSVRDANGHLVEEHTYDTQGTPGRVVASTGSLGVGALSFKYVDATHTEVTDSLGRVTAYTFGNFGDQFLVTQIQGPCPCGSPDTTFEYDNLGQRIAQTDARDSTTRFEYNADGDLVKATDALGQVTTRTYNAFGQVLTTTDPTGATTTFTYDEVTGFLRQTTNALGGTTTFTPDPRNLPGAVTNPLGHTTTTTFNGAGLLVEVKDPMGATTTSTYDDAGRLLTVTNPAGGITKYTYDQRGRVTTVTDPVGAVTKYGWDAAGNKVSVIDPNGRTTAFVYDAANRPIQVTDAAGGKTTWTYDTESNVLTVTDAKGNTTAFAYDGHNRPIRRTDPLGASESLSYDAVGNLATRTDRKGQTLTFNYDALNRLTEKVLPDGTSVRLTYDQLGRLLTATDANGTLEFAYDALGQMVQSVDQQGRTLKHAFDAAGNRVSRQDETGVVTNYLYDPRNLLTTMSDPRVGTFSLQYDALGRRIGLARPNGTTTGYAYDPASRLTGLTHAGPQGAFEAVNYSYEPTGNRAGDVRNGVARQYGYDPLNQLTAVQRQGLPEETFSYDRVGNRLTGPQQEVFIYDAANRLTQDSTYAYTYDANGNLVEKRHLSTGEVTTFLYDVENRLIQVVLSGGEVIFRYDPVGRRIERRVSGLPQPDTLSPAAIRYSYDGDAIVAAFDADTGQELARFTNGPGLDEPLAVKTPDDQVGFYHADVLGSITDLSDYQGNPVWRYQYSAFGVPDRPSDPQLFRFTGREWDREIGLYYYRARFYDPQLGRFLSEDPLKQDSNLYLYVGNNPATFVDPMGLFQFWRVVRGGFAVVVGSGLVLKGAAVTGGSGGFALPLGIYMVLSGTAIASTGVADVILGFTLPEETKVTLPAPTPEALTAIAVTGGNLETANKVNEVVDTFRTLNTIKKGQELTQSELTLLLAQLGAKGLEFWAEQLKEAHKAGSFPAGRGRCFAR